MTSAIPVQWKVFGKYFYLVIKYSVLQRSWVQILYRPEFFSGLLLRQCSLLQHHFHIHVFNRSSNIWLPDIHNQNILFWKENSLTVFQPIDVISALSSYAFHILAFITRRKWLYKFLDALFGIGFTIFVKCCLPILSTPALPIELQPKYFPTIFTGFICTAAGKTEKWSCENVIIQFQLH